MLLLVVAAACSSRGAPGPDRQRTTTAAVGSGPPGTPADRIASLPTFAGDVAPIIHRECTVCHNPEGQAPFSLRDYSDIAPMAERISAVVTQRRMPPWQPLPGPVEFAGERRLTAEEIDLIRRWVDAGAPEGDRTAELEPPERPGGWLLGSPDLVIEMPEPFSLPGEGPDRFRNFVIPIPGDTGRWVRSVELQPDPPGVVHHATILFDTTRHSRRLSARDTIPGFPGMHAGGRAAPPPGFILGWTPGRVPADGGGDLAWRLAPGTDLVLQLHLRPTGRPETVRARVGLHFTDEQPRERPVVLRLASETIDIPAGQGVYVVEDSYELPVPVRLLGLHPHAHYLARRMEVWATLPMGKRVRLLTIEDWNFDWQDFYRLAEPLRLPRGTVLRMRYSYDNSTGNPRNPHAPPRRVVYGPTAADEMGDLWIQVLPEDPGSVRLLERDFAAKNLATRMAGWRQAIQVRPDDARAHFGLGTVFFRRGWLDEAIGHLRVAVNSDPEHPHASYHLGLALEARGALDEAIAAYRNAIRTTPARADLYFNLALALTAAGRPDEGLSAFEEGARLEPADTRAQAAMAWALAARDDDSLRRPRDAIELATRALSQSETPRPRAHAALAAAYACEGDYSRAVREAEEALAAAMQLGDAGVLLLVDEHLASYRAGRLPDFADAD